VARALILGATGMLGSAVVHEFSRQGISFVAASRSPAPVPREQWRPFEVVDDAVEDLLTDYGPGDVVVNCIGIIKHHIDDRSSVDRELAIEVNSLFPYRLAEAASSRGARVLQIATDCVYSGAEGSYTEDHAHDPLDVYGKTKSVGEVPAAGFLNLRCSIIGRELKTGDSLMEWVLSHPAGSMIRGFTDHRWNGVTTDAFARIAAGLIEGGDVPEGTYHLVPHDAVTKAELCQDILDAFGRRDITVVPEITGSPIDRTLATVNPHENGAFWTAAGYTEPPTIKEMVVDHARWNRPTV
jgi:dTDP-4-dehydrorhamnose reductase